MSEVCKAEAISKTTVENLFSKTFKATLDQEMETIHRY